MDNEKRKEKLLKPELLPLIVDELTGIPRTMGDILKTYNENHPYSRLSHITMRKYLNALVDNEDARSVTLGNTTGYLKL